MNTLITGRIYHVVDKTTGEVVKVGSTIRELNKRFNSIYKKSHPNHFLKEIRVLQSSEYDWYIKGDYFCPFIWHLLAAEHLEILKRNTLNKGSFSNKQLPLIQKLIGFDSFIAGQIGGRIGGKIGGKISGKKNVESGLLASLRTPEHQSKAGKKGGEWAVQNKAGIHDPNFDHIPSARKGGLKNVESGHLQRISSLGGKISGAIQGKKNKESGHISALGKSIPLEVRKKNSFKGGTKTAHVRWHLKRGIVSPTCTLCKEQHIGINTSAND